MSAQAALLSSTTSSLASSLHLATDESLQNLEKLTGRCLHLHNSVSGTWCLIIHSWFRTQIW